MTNALFLVAITRAAVPRGRVSCLWESSQPSCLLTATWACARTAKSAHVWRALASRGMRRLTGGSECVYGFTAHVQRRSTGGP